MARPAYERVGAALRKAYETAGLRQTDVANALKVDPGTVSKWSRGLQKIDLDYFPFMDELCELPRGTILRWAGYVEDTTDTAAIVAADPGIDPEDKRALLRLIDLARQRYTGPVPNPSDPDEMEIWSKQTFTEDERRQLILGLREIKRSGGAELDVEAQ